MSQRYPLSWPEGWKRTDPAHRTRAQFGRVRESGGSHPAEAPRPVYKMRLNIEEAYDRIEYELERFGADIDAVIVSTNLKLNMRGVPIGNIGEPSDPGVAVYWQRKDKAQCMAIDRYTRVADNIAAVAATLEAMRAIERHGGSQILERAFIGFAQLPSSLSRSWREVLEYGAAPATRDLLEEQFRKLSFSRHPDHGGTHEQFVELERARREAMIELQFDALERGRRNAEAAG